MRKNKNQQELEDLPLPAEPEFFNSLVADPDEEPLEAEEVTGLSPELRGLLAFI